MSRAVVQPIKVSRVKIRDVAEMRMKVIEMKIRYIPAITIYVTCEDKAIKLL